MSQNLMQTDFIANAVNAFVNGNNFTERVVMRDDAAYMNVNVGEPNYAYEVSKDFSLKNNDVKFLCYIGGHAHNDYIWKHDTYEQYQISPICAAVDYDNAKSCDIRRNELSGMSYDCLTSISFDKTNNKVRLTKIGVKATIGGKIRDIEELDLTTTNSN